MPIAAAPLIAVPARPIPLPGAPWWRFAMVWFVLAGPAVVVVAALATVAVAFRNADTVIVESAPTAAGGDPAAIAAQARSGPTAPAQQARNHAATPVR